jgi:hypothetical protein
MLPLHGQAFPSTQTVGQTNQGSSWAMQRAGLVSSCCLPSCPHPTASPGCPASSSTSVGMASSIQLVAPGDLSNLYASITTTHKGHKQRLEMQTESTNAEPRAVCRAQDLCANQGLCIQSRASMQNSGPVCRTQDLCALHTELSTSLTTMASPSFPQSLQPLPQRAFPSHRPQTPRHMLA